MEISNAQHQGMSSQHQMEEVLSGCSSQSVSQNQQQQERRGVRPQPEHALRCPRCDSTNTKFCYYNNYSLTQPRYFCKGCRRYWTQGGSLRNVPVGGGCRKNKRSSSSKKPIQDQPTNPNPNPLLLPPMPPLLHYDPSDISLAFARLHNQPIAHHEMFLMGNPNPNPNPSPTGFLDILRGGFIDSTTTTTTPPNFYYGYGCNEGGGNGVEEMTLPFEGGDNKPTMGLQWTIGGDGGVGVDSGREYWNGSSWHGLINSSF